MPATVSVDETGLFVALQMWMADLLGIDWQNIARTQANRVPMMTGDFIYMTPITLTGLSYPRVVYAPELDQRIDTRINKWRVQLDFYGENGYEYATTVSTIMKTDVATQALKDTPITPLYADDPWQSAVINSEEQWEQRWTVDVHFEADIAITTDQQFADILTVETVPIEETFPSGE